MRTISLITFGCKLNQAESQTLKEKLFNLGFQIVSEKQKADIFIINACAVTAKAEKELRQKINQVKKQFPKSFLIVTGCYLPQKNNKVDLWIKRDKLIGYLSTQVIRENNEIRNSKKIVIGRNKTSRTRSFIKIQDGCDNYCTYCIVPFLRGKSKIRSLNSILSEIKKREKEGYKEIVLVGTDLRKVKSLVSLLKKILKNTKIPRIRISSLWPTAVTSDLINLIKNESRICPHLHLSIQSGSDKILKKMNRDYTVEHCKNIIRKIRDRISMISISADIIVGFPGEKEKDFQKTLNFVKKANFLKVHVFRYSPRPKTVAAKMPDQIPEKIKKERSRKLITLCEKISKRVKSKFLGQIDSVLIENQKNNFWTGFTPNYLRVYIKSLKPLANQIIKVKLLRLYKDGFYGKIEL
jgi:threonylcarbamoyladenosine tRNA methylthiotransferase MtaB